jgi:hypothetical protein
LCIDVCVLMAHRAAAKLDARCRYTTRYGAMESRRIMDRNRFVRIDLVIMSEHWMRSKDMYSVVFIAIVDSRSARRRRRK